MNNFLCGRARKLLNQSIFLATQKPLQNQQGRISFEVASIPNMSKFNESIGLKGPNHSCIISYG